MTFEDAARVLGVKLNGLTENEVRLAFARAVKLAHPDTGGKGNDESVNIDRAKKARDKLIAYVGDGENPVDGSCKPCKGTGTIMGLSRFGSQCPTCKGTGRENLSRR